MKTLDVSLGSDITKTIKSAIDTASSLSEQCCFEFNGVTVIVDESSIPTLIHRDWLRGLNGYLGDKPTVWPFPKAELSPEDIANDKRIEAENGRKRAKRQAEYEKEQQEKTSVLQELLSDAGPIELLDKERWQSFVAVNKSDYGARCVRYAEEWARLMQVRINNGDTVADCAKELSHIADDDGITGFMYGAAVSMLVQCWKYGRELENCTRAD